MFIKNLLTIFTLINTNTNCLNVPPIGNIYSKTFTIPLVGKQYIETEYFNKNIAHIRLNGIININGTSTIYCKNNKEKFILSENLINTMSKFKCTINKSYYDKNNDIIIINLCFRSIITKNILLEKITID